MSTTAHQDPTFQQYQRFWVVTESLTPRIYDELEEAIAKFQGLLREGYYPHFLGEKADDSLHDLSLPTPAVSPSETEARREAHQASCGQKYPLQQRR